jgi:1-acyl-sn-glycerol-3-phosphate acyltransferase
MPYYQPPGVRLFRALGRPFFRSIFRAGCHLSFSGLENVPPYGPSIVAMNHLASYDPPLLAVFWPYPIEGIAAANQMQTLFPGLLMRGYGAIPVHRGEYDREALAKAFEVLKAGSPLGIAPEGGRTHRPGMRKARPGVAYLALKTKVPIVPVGITGTENLIPSWRRLRRPHLSMQVGPPFHLPDDPLPREERHERLEALTTLIMKKIAEVLPVDYRGVYGS